MLHPELLPPAIRAKALAAAMNLTPLNLFNITWRDPGRSASATIVLPKELTGVRAEHRGHGRPRLSFRQPQGRPRLHHADGGRTRGEIQPGVNTIIGPSTGNFGIGVAYVSRLKGYPAVVIMPEQMSAGALPAHPPVRRPTRSHPRLGERRHPGPGAHRSITRRIRATRSSRSSNCCPTTASIAMSPAAAPSRPPQAYGNGRVAAFVSAPGSAGTIAAGDEIKAHFPECRGLRARAQGMLHPVQQRARHASHRRHRRQDGDPHSQRAHHRLRWPDPR